MLSDQVINRVRAELEKQIEDEKNSLVQNPTERMAGHVRGLMDALSLISATFSEMNGNPTSRQE